MVLDDLKKTFPFAVAVCLHPDFASPAWFNVDPRRAEGFVDDNGNVVVFGDTLEPVEGEIPPPGTAVNVEWRGRYVFIETSEAHIKRRARDEAERERKDKEYAERLRTERSERLRVAEAHASQVNGSLNVPVRWTSGFKSVLSGLSASSNGSGDNTRTVTHILLLENLDEGRFKRNAGSFLCTSAAGSDGERWTDLHTKSYGENGEYVSRITCSQCLKLVARWKDASARVEPELWHP